MDGPMQFFEVPLTPLKPYVGMLVIVEAADGRFTAAVSAVRETGIGTYDIDLLPDPFPADT